MGETQSGFERLRRVVASHTATLPERPQTAYELVTRQMVEQLARDLAEVKRRLDQLFTTVVGAIMLELLLRWWQ